MANMVVSFPSKTIIRDALAVVVTAGNVPVAAIALGVIMTRTMIAVSHQMLRLLDVTNAMIDIRPTEGTGASLVGTVGLVSVSRSLIAKVYGIRVC